MTKRQHLDADLARYVRRTERTPIGVLAAGIVGVAVMIAIDKLYNSELSPVAWLAIVGIASLTLPLTVVLRALAPISSAWALQQQAARRALAAPEDPPSRPPDRPTTRPRTAPGEKRSRARLTPLPDDGPPRKVGSP